MASSPVSQRGAFDHALKVQHKIPGLKYKELTAQKLVILEQELVQTEGDNLVTEPQLTNVTPAKPTPLCPRRRTRRTGHPCKKPMENAQPV